jgi:hypothetical protein
MHYWRNIRKDGRRLPLRNVFMKGMQAVHFTADAEAESRSTVSRPVCLGVTRPSRAHDQNTFFPISDIYVPRSSGRAPSLTRGRVHTWQWKHSMVSAAQDS